MAVDLSHSWVNKPALCKFSSISAHPFLVEILQKQCPKALTVIEISLVWASLVYKTGRYTNILLINFISIDFKFGFL